MSPITREGQLGGKAERGHLQHAPRNFGADLVLLVVVVVIVAMVSVVHVHTQVRQSETCVNSSTR